MPGRRARAEQAPDFFPAEDVGQRLRLPGRRDLKRRLLAPEGDVVEKPKRMRRLRAGAPRAFPRLVEMGKYACTSSAESWSGDRR